MPWPHPVKPEDLRAGNNERAAHDVRHTELIHIICHSGELEIFLAETELASAVMLYRESLGVRSGIVQADRPWIHANPGPARVAASLHLSKSSYGMRRISLPEERSRRLEGKQEQSELRAQAKFSKEVREKNLIIEDDKGHEYTPP